jgi:carboxylesterase
MRKKNYKILQGAGPFYFEGNNLGILMIHGGGGGTCADLKPLAEELHSKGGYTVNVPLLPGYGTTPEDLKKATISDWKSSLDEQLSKIREKCDKIIVGGHSMGGALTLILAAKYNFDGIFTICVPIGIKRFLFHFVPLFKIFVKYHSINTEQFKKETNGKWVGYNKIPLNIASKMKKIMKEAKESLMYINCPTLIFQGCLDSEIKRNSIDYIFENINSITKKKIWLENTGHPILNCPDHNQIVSKLLNFISEICT